MIALGLTSISAVFDTFILVNQTTISLRVIFIFGELLFWGGLQLVDVHAYILEPHTVRGVFFTMTYFHESVAN